MRKIIVALALALPLSWSFGAFAADEKAAEPAKEEKVEKKAKGKKGADKAAKEEKAGDKAEAK